MAETEKTVLQVGAIVGFVRRLAGYGTAVVLVHHTTKARDGYGSPRGHSFLNGPLDAGLSLAAPDGAVIRTTIKKNRNGPSDGNIPFRIELKHIGIGQDKEIVTAPTAEEVACAALTVTQAPLTGQRKPISLPCAALG